MNVLQKGHALPNLPVNSFFVVRNPRLPRFHSGLGRTTTTLEQLWLTRQELNLKPPHALRSTVGFITHRTSVGGTNERGRQQRQNQPEKCRQLHQEAHPARARAVRVFLPISPPPPQRCDHNAPTLTEVVFTQPDSPPMTSKSCPIPQESFSFVRTLNTKVILKVFSVMFSARTTLDYREQCFGGQAQSLIAARC